MANSVGGLNFINTVKRLCSMNVCLNAVFLALALTSAQTIANSKDIFLVRHFEKQEPTEQTGRDVSLTIIGSENAQKLAGWMQSNNVSHLFTTDYKRTKQSVQPTALANALESIIYDPNDLAVFAEKVKLLEGNILVLGHSNTTGVLYGLLGCEEVVLSESDYGDIFKVSINISDRSVVCERFRLE